MFDRGSRYVACQSSGCMSDEWLICFHFHSLLPPQSPISNCRTRSDCLIHLFRVFSRDECRISSRTRRLLFEFDFSAALNWRITHSHRQFHSSRHRTTTNHSRSSNNSRRQASDRDGDRFKHCHDDNRSQLNAGRSSGYSSRGCSPTSN